MDKQLIDVIAKLQKFSREEQFKEGIQYFQDFMEKYPEKPVEIIMDLEMEVTDEVISNIIDIAYDLSDIEKMERTSGNYFSYMLRIFSNLIDLSPFDAREFFWNRIFPEFKDDRKIDWFLDSYCSSLINKLYKPPSEKYYDEIRKLWETISQQFWHIDEIDTRGRLREKIISSLEENHEYKYVGEYLLSCSDEISFIPNRELHLFVAARDTDKIDLIQHAVSECKRRLAKSTDNRAWEEWRPVIDEFLEDVKADFVGMSYYPQLPKDNNFDDYIKNDIDTNKTTWGPREYYLSISKLRRVLDKWGNEFNLSLYDKCLHIHGKIGQYLPEKENQLEGLRQIIGKLEIVQLQLLINQIKSNQVDPNTIEKSMLSELDKLVQNVDFEDYTRETLEWIKFDWSLLDEMSKKYLPLAEYILEQLEKLPDTDFSPFIIEYCRALENELLKKAFESFNIRIHAEVDDLNDFLQDNIKKLRDIKRGKPRNICIEFANQIKNNQIHLSLGQMSSLLSYLEPGSHFSILKECPLLIEFNVFLHQYFSDKVVEVKFLKMVNEITKYRNKAAHPSILDHETAVNCRKLLREALNEFMASITRKVDSN